MRKGKSYLSVVLVLLVSVLILLIFVLVVLVLLILLISVLIIHIEYSFDFFSGVRYNIMPVMSGFILWFEYQTTDQRNHDCSGDAP